MGPATGTGCSVEARNQHVFLPAHNKCPVGSTASVAFSMGLYLLFVLFLLIHHHPLSVHEPHNPQLDRLLKGSFPATTTQQSDVLNRANRALRLYIDKKERKHCLQHTKVDVIRHRVKHTPVQ